MKYAESAWAIALIVLALYEAWALLTSHMTLSRFVWQAERTQWGPLIPFLAGMLAGHFFWSGVQ